MIWYKLGIGVGLTFGVLLLWAIAGSLAVMWSAARMEAAGSYLEYVWPFAAIVLGAWWFGLAYLLWYGRAKRGRTMAS